MYCDTVREQLVQIGDLARHVEILHTLGLHNVITHLKLEQGKPLSNMDEEEEMEGG